ncbi:MAG: zinc-dependent peptidase [Candidatus Omnitrophota bacterium]
MQIIYKVDVVFLVIYSILILSIGSVFAILGKWIWMPVALGIEGWYLFLMLRRPYKRYRALKEPVPLEWKRFLYEYCVFYRNSDPDHQAHFEWDLRIFLSDFPIRGIKGRPVNIETKLLIASGFATALHGQPDWEPPIKDGVLVYPGDRFDRNFNIGKGIRAGQASVNSPLIVTEESLKESFDRADDGYNVVYHELAHYFDMEDGMAKGIPTARLRSDQVDPWRAVIREEWIRATQGLSFLRAYAASNEAELFAVAVECFFENPRLMVRHNPALYEILKNFFNIDTVDVMNRL